MIDLFFTGLEIVGWGLLGLSWALCLYFIAQDLNWHYRRRKAAKQLHVEINDYLRRK